MAECPHDFVSIVELITGEVVRGICEDCGEEVPVESREDGSVWRWRGLRWEELASDIRSD